jgi:hypothetical protein
LDHLSPLYPELLHDGRTINRPTQLIDDTP